MTESIPAPGLLLGFHEYRRQAQNLADAAGIPCAMLDIHRFPDGESKLRLPPELPAHVVLCRSLDHPNDKLVEIILAAAGARRLGARYITLVAPYLCYMRQDKAFHPGEVVSQQVIGQCLAGHFNAVITVDAHLHRIHALSEAIPVERAINLTATDPMAHFLEQQVEQPFLIGPDAESEQWVSEIAAHYGMDYCVASKRRLGDREVEVTVPDGAYSGRNLVLVDDVASTGKTLLQAAWALNARQPASISVLVTHALFVDDAIGQLEAAGIRDIWSCDAIPHPSNAVPLAGLLATRL